MKNTALEDKYKQTEMNNNRYHANKRWRIIDLIQWTTQFFEKRHIENPRLNAERLLSGALGLDRVQLYLQFEKILTHAELDSFRAFVKRRMNNEPLQYILGETEFMSLKFKVTPSVLIPRPDTETLVEAVLNETPDAFPVRILDIGTGSGNIAVSLAHYLKQVQVAAVDISSDALELARENATFHKVESRIQFIQEDIFSSDFSLRVGTDFDILVSNPPYISEEEFTTLPDEVRLFEPHTALRDGSDGLTFHRRITELSEQLLRDGGKVYLEVGMGQAPRVREILVQAGFDLVHAIRDLAGIERVVTGTKKMD